MATTPALFFGPNTAARTPRLLACLATALVLTGCASGSHLTADRDAQKLAGLAGQTQLSQATAYWAQVYGKNPRNGQAAINYAMNLKAMGNKKKAFSVLQQASMYNRQDKRIASEYGRLALSLNKASLASKVLQFAHDPAKPDWRVVSGLGTAKAKLGHYKQAQEHFKQALELSPNNAKIMNNLALAYALDGKAQEAEPLLRQAASSQQAPKRVRENLALVLGLQGRFNEAQDVAGSVLPAQNAQQNVAYLRQMVDAMPQADERPQSIIPAPDGEAPAGDNALRGTQPAPVATADAGGWGGQVSVASAAKR